MFPALQMSEIDYPPEWLDRYSLRMTAACALLSDDQPGHIEVGVNEPQMLEAFECWFRHDGEGDHTFWFRFDLAEAVGDMIALESASSAQMLDWARHLELLAARLRAAVAAMEFRIQAQARTVAPGGQDD